MYYVYILKSINHEDKVYVGYSINLKARLQDHNAGESVYTKDYRPWKLIFYSSFIDKFKALEFEKYLKSHAGRVFLQKRLV